jgi:hypothetical protein
MSLPFVSWWDPDPERPQHQKLADAMARFREKFQQEPRFALVSPEDAELVVPGVEIHANRIVQPNTFYVGDTPPSVIAQWATARTVEAPISVTHLPSRPSRESVGES